MADQDRTARFAGTPEGLLEFMIADRFDEPINVVLRVVHMGCHPQPFPTHASMDAGARQGFGEALASVFRDVDADIVTLCCDFPNTADC
jgi:hypothetical protein